MMRFYHSLRNSLRGATTEAYRRILLSRINGGCALHLEGRIEVVHPQNLVIGNNVHIGRGGYFNCYGGVSIGDNTMISRQVTIYSYDHQFRGVGVLPFAKVAVRRPVSIGNYVWIGMNVSIAPGTVIEDGAIIGMGTVVSGVVPANAIVVGAKHRIVGYRDADEARACVALGSYYLPGELRT